MWFDNEFSEVLKAALPYYLVVMLPVFIILSPAPVQAAHEFTVYRMQHYDLHNSHYGSRSALASFDARSLETRLPARKCILTPIMDITVARFKELVQENAGAIVLMLPNDLAKLEAKLRDHILELEVALLGEEVPIPVYFVYETPEVLEIYRNIVATTRGDSASSAAAALMDTVLASGFQLSVSGSQAKAITDVHIANILGKLPGYGAEEQLPTVAIVAHYDSFGVAPELATGTDSNGSGVAVLLELARLFSRLTDQSHRAGVPRFNLLFLLSGAGKFNYLGSKKFLEDQLDGAEGSWMQDTLFTLCLDSLGDGDDWYMHVSKPPKENTPSASFYNELERLSGDSEMKIGIVHKKINLAEDRLAWEHERYSIRRLPAFTLSGLPSSKISRRNSILDRSIDATKLTKKVKIIAESLAKNLYNISEKSEVFTGDLAPREESITAFMTQLTSQSRAAQLVASKHNPVVGMLEQALQRYTKEVKVSYLTPDKREPDFVFYDMNKATMFAYSIKPAIFDLVLTVLIVVYLCAFYGVVQNFSWFYSLALQTVPVSAKKKL
nr:EOG090X02MW [Triops cancriformis]